MQTEDFYALLIKRVYERAKQETWGPEKVKYYL